LTVSFVSIHPFLARCIIKGPEGEGLITSEMLGVMGKLVFETKGKRLNKREIFFVGV